MMQLLPVKTVVSSVKICPKCTGNVSSYGDFPSCIQCGWTDYNPVTIEKETVLSSQFRISLCILDYIGPDEPMKGKKVEVRLAEVPYSAKRVIYHPKCPHCNSDMQKNDTAISNGSDHMGNGITDYYYICDQDHRIRISDSKTEGFIGWK